MRLNFKENLQFCADPFPKLPREKNFSKGSPGDFGSQGCRFEPCRVQVPDNKTLNSRFLTPFCGFTPMPVPNLCPKLLNKRFDFCMRTEAKEYEQKPR